MNILVGHCHPKQVNLAVLLAHQIRCSHLALGGAYWPVGVASMVAAHPWSRLALGGAYWPAGVFSMVATNPCIGRTDRGAGPGSTDEWGGWISATDSGHA